MEEFNDKNLPQDSILRIGRNFRKKKSENLIHCARTPRTIQPPPTISRGASGLFGGIFRGFLAGFCRPHKALACRIYIHTHTHKHTHTYECQGPSLHHTLGGLCPELSHPDSACAGSSDLVFSSRWHPKQLAEPAPAPWRCRPSV